MKGYLLKIVWAFIVLLISSNTIFSQEKKLKKGKNQFDRYQYIDAQQTYLKVVKKGYKSADLYMNLGDSYYFNSQYKEALKWYEELINSYTNEVEPEYYFRYAQTLKATENYQEANKYMQKFAEVNSNDQRAKLFQSTSDYLKRIDFQSGRFEIKNAAVNTLFADFGAAFYGENVVFTSSRDTLITRKAIHQWNDESFLNLFEAKYNDSDKSLSSEVERFDRKINSKFHESTPVFTKDQKTVYFTRNNFENRKLKRDQKGTNKLKIYRSYRNAQGGWTTPQSLTFNSDEYSVAHPALSNDEKTLYFSSDMPGGKGSSDLYEVTINADGTFGEPKNLGDRINTEGKETFPFIGENNTLYFSSEGHMGLGGLDIYVTNLNPQTKEEKLVVNVGKPINGPNDDFAFIVNSSKRGYFSSNREGGKGSDDIYSFVQIEDLKSFCEITIAGLVSDKDTNELLSGTKVSIYDNNNNLVQSFIVGDEATYSQLVKCQSSYFVRAEREEYVTLEKLVNTLDETQTMDTPLLLEKKIKTANIGDDLAKILALKTIYFDFGGAYIRSDAKVELARVIEVLNQYPEMKIEVKSHTDSHGDDAYNKWLSEKRAKATVQYMIDNGVSKDRLTGKGYGETQPVNECGNESNCKKEEYQLNRRSEFIIVK